MTDELCFTPATELARMLRRREVSAVEIMAATASRIERRNPVVNAFTLLRLDDAMTEAKAADERLVRGGPLGPLHGLPICLKDLYEDKAGLVTTMGAPAFAHYVPERSSAYVQRLEAAGAIVVGKTNVPEFGADPAAAVADNATFGATLSPLAPGRSAGGSSGGSAAAVVDGMVALAQGSDGGGSLRIPASLCGAYTIKPTFGRVPNVVRPDGFSPGTPKSCYGPIARTVGDAALMLGAMHGHDPRDPHSAGDDGLDPVAAGRRGDLRGVRIAYSPDFGGFPVDERVAALVADAVTAFADAGAEVTTVELTLPADQQVLSDVWMLQVAVVNASLVEMLRDQGIDVEAHFDELGEEFRGWVRRGQRMSVLEYVRADRIRTAVLDMIEDVFDRFDLLVTPTLATPPFPVGTAPRQTQAPTEINGVPVAKGIGWCLTYPLNFTGHPAASVPAGMSDVGPVGMQLIGRRFDDAGVLAASRAFERVRPWHGWYDVLHGPTA